MWNKTYYFFDSYGVVPEKRVRRYLRRVAVYYMNKTKKRPVVEYNRIRHQFENSECGVYSINFILITEINIIYIFLLRLGV